LNTKNMNKAKKIMLLVGCLVVLALLGWGYQYKFLSKAENVIPLPEKQGIVFLTINNGQTELNFETIINKAAFTALDALEQVATENNFTIQKTDYGEMGFLVESIANVKNGTDNKYWIYYVNNEQAQVSASLQQVISGDLIEFKFEGFDL